MMPRFGPGGAVEPAAVAYDVLRPPFEIDPAFAWFRLQGFFDKAEAQLYVGWANDIYAERAHLAWLVFGAAGLEVDPGSGDLLGLADFLLSWYPHVMAPFERVPTVHLAFVGHPGNWASPEAVALEVSLAHDLGFIVASEVTKVYPGLSWGLKAKRLVFPGGYGEDVIEQGKVVLFRALLNSDPTRAVEDPRDPRSWAVSRTRLRYAADVVLHAK